MLSAVRDPWRRTRAESLVARPGTFGAMGELRAEVLVLRAEAEAELVAADEALRRAADARLAAVARLRACNRALVGTGVVDGGQYLLRRSDAVHDPMPDPATLEVVAGEELRELLVELLRVVGRPATVAELVRLVAAHGYRPPGRATQSVSNALRVEQRWETVRRVERGIYTAT